MTSALRSVMTGAALTLGGLKAAPVATIGASITPDHWFSAVGRTATRHARSGLALGLLACAGLAHAATADPAQSGAAVTMDNKRINGTQWVDADQWIVIVRDSSGALMGGQTVTFDATPDVAFGWVNGDENTSTAVGAPSSCVTQRSGTSLGTCWISATSTVVGTKRTVARVNGVALNGTGTHLRYNYTPSPVVYTFTPLSPRVLIYKTVTSDSGSNTFNFALSGLSASTDSITVTGVASGEGTPGLTGTAGQAATISESSPAGWPVNPVSASCVDGSYTRSGNPSTAFGTLSSNVLSIPAAYMRDMADIVCTFTNNKPPADPAQSGVAAQVDYQYAQGPGITPYSANFLYVRVRDSNGNPVGNEYVTFEGTPTVSFNGGAVGAAGRCGTSSEANIHFGWCFVNAYSTVPGTKSTTVRISSGVMTGDFSANGGDSVTTTHYTSSPVVYHFVPSEPRLRIVKTVTSGSGTNVFNFSLSGLSTGNDSITVTDVGSGNGAAGLTGTNGSAATITESSPAGWPDPVSASCVDANYARSGNPSTAFGTLSGNVLSIPAANMRAAADITCTFINNKPPADPAQSGVIVLGDYKFTGGPNAYEMLIVRLHDSNGNTVGGERVTFDATPTVSFDGGVVGEAGSCVTSLPPSDVVGRCSVSVTSAVPGTKTTVVRVSSGVLTGDFSMPSGHYTPSPAVYHFLPYEPRLRIVKTVAASNNDSDTNFFDFSLSGLSAGTDRVAVVGPWSGKGTAGLTGTAGLAVTISESSPAGWPVNPVSASCVDANYADSGNSSGAFGTLNGNVLSIPAANMLNKADITCTFTNAFSFTVTGRAFTDNGIGGGAANDGVMNGGETGTGGVGIKLTNCAGGVISTAATDGNGAYVLNVPFSTNRNDPLCVEKTTLVPRLSTGASIAGTPVPSSTSVVASDTFRYAYARTGPEKISFQWNGTGHYNLNFGDVEPNTFLANGTKSGPAGNSVSYSHTFNAQTGGSVSFSIASAVASPAVSGWNEKVFADTACTGSLQAGAALLYPPAVPVPTTAGQIICVVMQEFIPLTAPLGHTNTAVVQASFTFTNASPAMSATYSVTDVTTSGSGALDLKKEVRNVTAGGEFGLNNQAKSGETLEYRITYINNGADPIRGLSVTDVTPNHTTFVSASNGTTPAALTSCQKQTPANPAPAATVACDAAQMSGGTGSVSLRYVGSVGPGAIGIVLFQVKVD